MFVVTAARRDERFRTTRIQKAGAIVPAMRLIEEGYSQVLVADGNGAPLDLASVRQTHLPGTARFGTRSGP